MTSDPIRETLFLVDVDLGPEVEIGYGVIVGYDGDREARHRLYGLKGVARAEPALNSTRVGVGRASYIGPYSVIGAGVTIGTETIVEHGCYIGSGTSIGDQCFLRYGAQVYRRVRVGNRCLIGGFVCNDATIHDDAQVYGSLVHRSLGTKADEPEKAPVIEQGAFIAFGAVVVGGIRIGARSVVEANAVVAHDVKEGSVVRALNRDL